MYDLQTFTFGKGSHPTREDGMCVNECAAMLAGESHSDHPACLCPVIAPLTIWVNDSCEDALRNELLRDLPWRMVGTKATPEIERQRAYMAADWAVRFVAPIMLRQAGLEAEAIKLESLPVIDCEDAASAASHAASDAASHAARAASYAARAASHAASDAASHAARAASYAARAASHAARAASYAARAASYAASALEAIQRSCVDLIDRMIRLTEPQEVVLSASRALVVVK